MKKILLRFMLIALNHILIQDTTGLALKEECVDLMKEIGKQLNSKGMNNND